jgi:hypothetical protein
MGIFDRHKAKVAAREAEHARAEQQSALDAWTHRDELMADALELAKNGGSTESGSLILKKGEEVFLIGEGMGLVEPRRLPGHWVGRSQGVSFHIAKGLNYRVGASRGTFQQGDEVVTPIDFGTATITNHRVVFQGQKSSREWAFAKLLGFQHDPERPITYLQVSNREKVSGILYDDAGAEMVRLRLTVALAREDGDASEAIPGLEAELAEHRASRPSLEPIDELPQPTGEHS